MADAVERHIIKSLKMTSGGCYFTKKEKWTRPYRFSFLK
jgi:hypothetical protein